MKKGLKKFLASERNSTAELLREERKKCGTNSNEKILVRSIFRVNVLEKGIRMSDIPDDKKFKKFMRLENIKSMLGDLWAKLDEKRIKKMI